MFLVAFIGGCFVGAIFGGAYTHALANIYCDVPPNGGSSVRFGLSKACNVVCYSLILLAILTVLAVILFFAFSRILAAIIFFVLVVVLITLMIAAVPSIVVEGKPPFGAILRSWNLSKKIFCNIFFTIFLSNVMQVIVLSIINALPEFLAVILHLGLNVFVMTFCPILPFVLYMSARIRFEGTTKGSLQEQLGIGAHETALETGIHIYDKLNEPSS